MSEDWELEQELDHLAQALRPSSSVVDEVMRRVEADAIASEIQPAVRLVPDVPTEWADGVPRGAHLNIQSPARRRMPGRLVAMFQRRKARWLSAAAIVIVVLGGFSVFSRSARPTRHEKQWWLAPSPAWAGELRAALRTVKALTFREQMVFVGAGGSTHVSGSWRQCYEASDRSRVDQYYNDTLVSTGWDIPEGKDLLHYGVSYEYECYTLRREQGAVYQRDPAAKLRFYERFHDKADRVLDPKVVDGRNCVGFEAGESKTVDHGPQITYRIWVDVETRLPVRLEIHGLPVTDHPEQTETLIQDRFQYHADVPTEMFTPVIPSGFANTDPDSVRQAREARDKGRMEWTTVPPEWKQQAVAALKAAKTVAYRSGGSKICLSEFAWRVDSPEDGHQPSRTEWFVIEKRDPAKTSLDVTDEAYRLVQTIVDYERRTYKQVVFGAKDHPRHPMDEILHPFGFLDLADRVLPLQAVDGIRCIGVVISAKKYGTNPEGMLNRLWLDEKTKLPVRMEFEFINQEGHTMTSVKDHFQWDPQLSQDTFVPTIPNGFVEAKD